MKTYKPLARFRIYAHNSSFYFLVYVWKYKYQMHQSWNRNDQAIGDCEAFTHPYTIIKYKNKKRRMLPICGEIHFYKNRIGTEIITHESAHAAMAVLRRKHFWFDRISNDQNDDYMNYEEELCYIIGNFARQIVDKLYRLKILP